MDLHEGRHQLPSYTHSAPKNVSDIHLELTKTPETSRLKLMLPFWLGCPCQLPTRHLTSTMVPQAYQSLHTALEAVEVG